MKKYVTSLHTDTEGVEWVTRTGDCAQCGETFTPSKRHPARGRWPSMHPDCAAKRERDSNRERMRANRAGERVPSYQAVAPLWDESQWDGPGSRKVMSNARSLALTRWSEEEMNYQPALKGPKLFQTDFQGEGTPEVKARRAPVPTGDAEVDFAKWALAQQESDKQYRTSSGPNEGRTCGVPVRALDDESKEWLRQNPDWWKEEKTEDGGWGCRRDEFAKPPEFEYDDLPYYGTYGVGFEDEYLSIYLDIAYDEWREEGDLDYGKLEKMWRDVSRKYSVRKNG